MPEKMSCVKDISVTDKDCLNSCDGLFITSYEKKEFDADQVGVILSLVNDDYEKYKAMGLPKYPPSLMKGESLKAKNI